MALKAWIVVALSLVLAAPMVARAQSGGSIAEIRVEGNERIEPSFVETYLTVGIGDPFDPLALDASLRSVFETGLFADVRLDREGDVLVVAVEENPFINRIAFEGNRRIENDALAAEIDLRSREVFSRARVQAAVARILEIYRRNGRFAATVEPKIIELEQNRIDLVFEIVEGPLTTVSGISFVGNEVFGDGRLRDVIQTTESRFWKILASADTYDPDRLAFDEELLRRFYLDRGFIDFEVLSAIAELTPDGESFFITFTVSEGERYRFGAIEVESRIRDLDGAELERLLEMRTGQIYRARDVEATIGAMVERVGQLGYAFVDIDPQLRRNVADQTVDIVFVVNEGPRVYVERIDIINNLRTLDSVIRRELLLAEGDAFNSALLRESERRIRRLGFFANVELRTRQGSAPDRTIIEIEVQEQSTGELAFGAGFSTTDGPLGQVNFSERNLLGTGRSIRAEFTLSGRRQDIDFSYTEPYFLDYEAAVGFDLFSRQTDFQDESSFDERNTGFTLRASYPLTRNINHIVRYSLRDDEIRNVADDASVFIKQEEGSSVTSSIGQSFSVDLRDNFTLPNEGYVFRLDQDFAGLGGDRTFIRNELTLSYYQPLWREDVVANVRFLGGHVTGIGDDVQLSNRFFVGGNDFRGFAVGGIGPRDSETRDSLGGNLYYIGTAELRFPLGLSEDLGFFGRAFVDAGSLTEIDVSGPTLVDTGQIRVTTGVGISWISPFGPLALDFGQAVVKDDLDETEFFRFLRHPLLSECARVARLVLMLLLATGVSGVAHAQPGPLPPAVIAIVDYQRVLRDSNAALSIRAAVEDIRVRFETEIDRERERLEAADAELTAQRGEVDAETYREMRRAFEADVAGVQRLVQQRRSYLDTASSTAFQRVRDEIIRVMNDLGDVYAFTVVLPRSDVLVFTPELDLTAEVMAALNERLPAVDLPAMED